MIKVTLPDGSVREYAKGTTSLQVAQSISEGLARNVLSAKINGEVWDGTRPINNDCSLQLLTWNDQEGKSTRCHSSAHLMAEALEALYPGSKFAIGPAIENGFYYDVDFGDKTFSIDEVEKVEAKMMELAAKKSEYVRKDVSKADAITYFREKG